VNTLFFSDAWIGCNNYTSELLISDIKNVQVETTECFISNVTSNAYLSDPCCNSDLLNKQCCSPRKHKQEEIFYSKVATSKIQNQCDAPSCVSSYMQDYLVLEQESLSCSSFASDEYPLIYSTSLQFYVDCKTKYNIDQMAFGNVVCTNDESCTFGGVKNQCNRVTNRCILSKEAETKAWNCVIDGLDEYKEYYLKFKYDLPGRKTDSEFSDALRRALSTSDCINVNGQSSVYSLARIEMTCLTNE